MNNNKKLLGAGAIFTALAVVGGTVLERKRRKNKKDKENAIRREVFETGTIRKLGTLYLNGVKQKCPTDLINYDDIYEYMGEKIEIKDTDSNDKNVLSWVEINDNGKKLLICDRNILSGVSWDELNEQDLVNGKVVVIDGKKYLLRLIKGGNYKKDTTDNEWNKYIINEEEIPELPLSSEIDKSDSSKYAIDKLEGENNNLWHWIDMCSLTQNTYSKNEKQCIIRGFYSNMYINNVKKEVSYKTVGYRPVLESID